jgi:hypothetical protein
MSQFKIQNQEDFNDCLMWVSDLYKDVYGSRPRGYDFQSWSFQELQDFVDDLIEMNDNQIEAEKAHEDQCVAEFRKKFEAIMEEQGQGYHKALEWMFDGFIAEEGFDYYSIEMFEYYHGISYTELGHKIKKDLEDLVQSNKKYIYNEHIDMAPEVEDQEEILNKEHDPLFQ